MTAKIRIAERMNPRPTEEELLYFQQMGIDAASIWTTIEDAHYAYMVETRERLAAHGIELWNIGILDLHCDPTMVLGLAGFDEKIAQYKNYLRDLGRAGIGYTTYAHMANIKMLPYYQTAVGQTRGIATREFDMNRAVDLPLSHEREYSQEEVWQTLEHFLAAVVPVAEEAGVRIGLHPDDPPVPTLGGVGRVVNSFAGYQRALEAAADSPNFGLCLCVGSWAEGGAELGKDVYEMIEYYGAQGKLFKIHFRNVDQPLPLFRETMVDDGYIDMFRVMEALHAVGFDGALLPDHVPGDRAHAAYTIGYMRAARKRVCGE
jgi:mannonate dehydratase